MQCPGTKTFWLYPKSCQYLHEFNTNLGAPRQVGNPIYLGWFGLTKSHDNETIDPVPFIFALRPAINKVCWVFIESHWLSHRTLHTNSLLQVHNSYESQSREDTKDGARQPWMEHWACHSLNVADDLILPKLQFIQPQLMLTTSQESKYKILGAWQVNRACYSSCSLAKKNILGAGEMLGD